MAGKERKRRLPEYLLDALAKYIVGAHMPLNKGEHLCSYEYARIL